MVVVADAASRDDDTHYGFFNIAGLTASRRFSGIYRFVCKEHAAGDLNDRAISQSEEGAFGQFKQIQFFVRRRRNANMKSPRGAARRRRTATYPHLEETQNRIARLDQVSGGKWHATRVGRFALKQLAQLGAKAVDAFVQAATPRRAR
jgi:hypothetical protein